MRIRFTMSGGLAHFPGLNKPVHIDTDALDAAARDELLRLVHDAGFFDLPASANVVRGGVDQQVEEVCIEQDDGRAHTVRLGAVQPEPAVAALLTCVRRQAKAVRSAAAAAAAKKET